MILKLGDSFHHTCILTLHTNTERFCEDRWGFTAASGSEANSLVPSDIVDYGIQILMDEKWSSINMLRYTASLTPCDSARAAWGFLRIPTATGVSSSNLKYRPSENAWRT